MMRLLKIVCSCAAALLVTHHAAAQTRPYIGFAYPAGGQQGATFRLKLGGQGLDDTSQLYVTGEGVTARLLEFQRPLNPQEMQLLNEQLRDLRRQSKSNPAPDNAMMADNAMISENAMMASLGSGRKAPVSSLSGTQLIAKIEKRVADYVNRPACNAIAGLAYLEVTIASNAPPGEREIRIATSRGLSNPLAFHVGQLPEYVRKPMLTASFQVLGKEELALRKRSTNEVEVAIIPPCTVNGQIASGELNKYRFQARKGQRLVFNTYARRLIPYIADAVPGWFQPVIAIFDSKGKELAYCDDYRFRPDPTILFEAPSDGEYLMVIHDSIYRGREDFVYRVTVGEVPFVTSVFPLGSRAGTPVPIKTKGWNLGSAEIVPPDRDSPPGRYSVITSKDGILSNPLPFAIDSFPETMEREQNHPQSSAQKVTLPTIVNGRIDFADDWDIYAFKGKAGSLVVAEVSARRLDSALDAVVKITDASGKILGLNDDREDPGSGANTHHADSYLMARIRTNGTYFVHVGDMSRGGGDEFGYRLRISPPEPDFEVRVVPSSISIRSSNTASVSVYAFRKDGFTNTIRVALKDPPPGFSAPVATLSGTQAMTRLTIRANLLSTKKPVSLSIMATGRLGDRYITNYAVAAEDRMQAFLWRHLVPAQEFTALVYDPAYTPPPKRIAPARSPAPEAKAVVESKPAATNAAAATNATVLAANKPKFSKQQVAGRLRQLKSLFEEGLLTDSFYADKVAECESVQ